MADGVGFPAYTWRSTWEGAFACLWAATANAKWRRRAGEACHFPEVIQKRQQNLRIAIKIASHGKKYIVLTEEMRDGETQEVKKRILRVFEQDFKDFFAMLQETVVFLRNPKDSPVAEGAKGTAPAGRPAQAASARKAPAPVAKAPPVSGNGKRPLPIRPLEAKPAVAAPAEPRFAKPAGRPGQPRAGTR